MMPLVLLVIISSSIIGNNELENARLIDSIQLVTLGMILGVLIYRFQE